MNSQVNKSIFNETGCIRSDQLLRYRDHQLNSTEQHEVEEHLVDCDLCNEALEGLALISGTAILNSIDKDVTKLVAPSFSQMVRPWLAAATIAGVVVISYFTYRQYYELSEERMALKQEVIQDTQKPVMVEPKISTPQDSQHVIESTITASGATMKSNANQKELNFSNNQISTSEAAESESTSLNETTQGYSDSVSTAKVMAAPPATSKDVALFSTAPKNSGNQNITYVDNVKVIDYNDYDNSNTQEADVPRSIDSKYQNKNKKTEAAEVEKKSGMDVNRRADYLELVADPVILFNNGRFESANAGFDKLLELNSNDQNAAFYKGLSLYNLKQYDPALDLLEPISNDSTSPFMEEARFYTARSYISNGNETKGKIILENISNSNGFYSDKAKEELKKIK